jgi:hypothetical protein
MSCGTENSKDPTGARPKNKSGSDKTDCDCTQKFGDDLKPLLMGLGFEGLLQRLSTRNFVNRKSFLSFFLLKQKHHTPQKYNAVSVFFAAP